MHTKSYTQLDYMYVACTMYLLTDYKRLKVNLNNLCRYTHFSKHTRKLVELR